MKSFSGDKLNEFAYSFPIFAATFGVPETRVIFLA